MQASEKLLEPHLNSFSSAYTHTLTLTFKIPSGTHFQQEPFLRVVCSTPVRVLREQLFSIPVSRSRSRKKVFCSRSRIPVPEKNISIPVPVFPFPYSRSRKFSKWILFFRCMGKVSLLAIGFGRHHTLRNL